MRSATLRCESVRLAAPRRRQLNLSAPLPSHLCCLCRVLFLLVLSGCGTGDYEQRLDQRHADKIKIEKKFSQLYAPQDVPGTQVSVRLPKTIFTEPPLVEGALVGGKPVDIRRVKPDKLVTIPGLKLTYEGFVENDGVKLPCYCYVGATAASTGEIGDSNGKIQAELAAQPPHDTLTNWERFQPETPDGHESQWVRLRFMNKKQEFFTVDKAGQGQFKTMPGVLEVYLHAEPGYAVVIAWRMPTSIEGKVKLAKWASLVAGCVSVKK